MNVASTNMAALLLTLGLALGLMACSTSKHKGKGSDHAHSPPAGHAALELNDGQKWVVAKPMMAHIRNLEKAVNDFPASNPRDHAALAAAIQDNLGKLVTNCTMEGKAHDELHKWLMPFLGVSADYAKTTDPREQQDKFEEIQHSLAVFNEYFE